MKKTLIKENKIKELGYNLVTILEKINKAVRTIQRKFLQK
jgi:hypothetical protein